MDFNKYRSNRNEDYLKDNPHLYAYDIKELSKEQSLDYVKEYINEYIGAISLESNTSIKNKEYIKNIFKYRPKNEHKDITELIDNLVPKRKENTKQPQTSNTKNIFMKFNIHDDDTFTKESLHKLTDNQLCENLDGIMAK